MALRPWSGPLTVEGSQTGDGRVIAAEACTFAPLPLPLSWIEGGDQHVDLVTSAPQIGTIETLERNGRLIMASGFIDDAIPQGAEQIRRMEAGSASHGNRGFVSIDPDDWAYDVLVDSANDEDGVVILAASGMASPGTTWVNWHPLRALKEAGLAAAAGEKDPGDSDQYTLVFQDAADLLLARFTRMRIRGVTMCAVPAFDEAHIGLEPVTASARPFSVAISAPSLLTENMVTTGTRIGEAVASSVSATLSKRTTVTNDPPLPTRADFDPPVLVDGSLNIEDRRAFGWVALWDTCHIGYQDRCVPPPREDPDYRLFHHGTQIADDVVIVRTGPLTWGIPHANLNADLLEAQAHYADSSCGFADVTVGADDRGIWFSGRLRHYVTDDDIDVLRGLSISGDWRWHQESGQLRMIAGLAVNYPGFPVPRLIASASARRAVMTSAMPEMRTDGDRILSLVAAGMVPPSTSSDHACSCGSVEMVSEPDPTLARIEAKVDALERRTRHLRKAELADVYGAITAHLR